MQIKQIEGYNSLTFKLFLKLSQAHVRGTEKGKKCLANCDIHSPLVYYTKYTTHFGQNRPITLLRK